MCLHTRAALQRLAAAMAQGMPQVHQLELSEAPLPLPHCPPLACMTRSITSPSHATERSPPQGFHPAIKTGSSFAEGVVLGACTLTCTSRVLSAICHASKGEFVLSFTCTGQTKPFSKLMVLCEQD